MCILPFFPVKHNSKISSINIQVRDYLVVIQYVTVLFFKQILSKLTLSDFLHCLQNVSKVCFHHEARLLCSTIDLG